MESIEAKIKELRERSAERETARYPEAFKEDATALVVELREKGWTQQAISTELEIPWVTLARWKKTDVPGDESSARFRPVKLVRGQPTPALVSPSGWRIEGLTLSQIVEVAGRL